MVYSYFALFSVGKTKKPNQMRRQPMNPDQIQRAWETDKSAADSAELEKEDSVVLQ